jgi:hypothetical protein
MELAFAPSAPLNGAAMNALPRVVILLISVCALHLVSCSSQPPAPPGKKLKLEIIQRPFGPTSYLFRQTSDPSH